MSATETGTVPSHDHAWEMEVTSPALRKWTFILIAIIMVIHIFMGVMVGVGDSGLFLTLLDQLAFVGIGLVLSACTLLLLRNRVRVSSAGVEVRNILSPKFYPWDMIHGLSFPQGSRWARLELPDFEFVPILALQIADKESIVSNVTKFRELEDRYMPLD